MFNTLSKEQLHRSVPSIFTIGQSSRTSERYQQISTANIIEKLIQEGFFPTWATQTISRNKELKAFAKHMVRFRRADAKVTSAGIYPELVLVNSHDGLSSYRLMAGLYRCVCSNGLIIGHSYSEVRVRHQGDILGNVIEGTYEVVNTANNMLDVVEDMTSMNLREGEKIAFAEAAHSLRFDEFSALTVKPQSLLLARRNFDSKSDDLFTVFNVLEFGQNRMKTPSCGSV